MFPGDLPPFEDIVRSVHFATIGASALLVISADLTASKSAIGPLKPNDFSRLHKNHAALTWGLLLFWISGAYLVWDGTGFHVSEFSPKLIAKLMVVSILTLNASVIGRLLLPFMEGNAQKTFGEFPLGARLRLALSGAVSSASWISAFCLGYFTHLKTANVIELTHFLAPIYGTLISLAVTFAIVKGHRKSRPDPIVSSSPAHFGPHGGKSW